MYYSVRIFISKGKSKKDTVTIMFWIRAVKAMEFALYFKMIQKRI